MEGVIGNHLNKIKILMPALMAIMLILVSASGDKDEKSEKPPEKKITIAVYPIKMAGADKALTEPLTQILIREISRSPIINVVEEDMIAEVLKKQGFANSDLCDNTQCQISIGKLTPAQKLVTPALSKLGNKFILDLKVTDIQTGVVGFVASREKVCTEDDLDQLAAEAALELRAKFGEKVARPYPAAQPQSSPVSPSTQSLRRENLDKENLLGIVVVDTTAQQRRLYGNGGVVVQSILPDSPCKNFFTEGNIIVKINPQGTMRSPNSGKYPGEESYWIKGMADFTRLVSSIKPGASVGISIYTPGKHSLSAHIVECVISSQPQASPQTSAPAAPEKKAKR